MRLLNSPTPTCWFLALVVLASAACRAEEPTRTADRAVTVYVSTDRVFSAPLLVYYDTRPGL